MRRPVHRFTPRTHPWLLVASLGLLLVLQACGGNGNNYTSHGTNGSGTIGVNPAAKFSGHLLFVKNRNIFVLTGQDNTIRQLTTGGDSLQPALSPDGATLAFVVRQPNNDYSDIATLPLAGGTPKPITDNSMHQRSYGKPTDPPNHYQWWANNPIWTSDGQQIIYLSDYFKGGDTTPDDANPTCFGISEGPNAAWILDMGIVALSANAQPLPALAHPPTLLAWPYCGAGGDQDVSLRPGVTDTEVLFTSFRYSGDKSDLVAQLSLLIIPASGPEQVIQLSPEDPSSIPFEPSWSPDGMAITYIRRENGQDNLYSMPVERTITGTPNDETYSLYSYGASKKTVYFTNTSYYDHSQKLAEGILGNPLWISSQQLVFMQFDGSEFNLFLATVKLSIPPTAATDTPGATAMPTISLVGTPSPLTQGGVDGESRPVWYP